MKNILTIIYLICLYTCMTSCVNHKSVLKWIRNHPDKVEQKEDVRYIVKRDTFTVYTKSDTLVKNIQEDRNKDIDTSFTKGKAEVIFKVKHDTITKKTKVYIRAICNADTVYIPHYDTIQIVRTTTLGVHELTWWEKHKDVFQWIIVIGILFFVFYSTCKSYIKNKIKNI